MSQLHTLNSPTLLESCLRALRAGDRLLLLADGVYCGCDSELLASISAVEIVALHDDLLARGLGERVAPTVQSVSMSDFVRLCCESDKVINWF